MRDLMVATLVGATHDVFRSMVARELSEEAPIVGDALRPKSNVVGTVGFTGSERGLVAFYSTLDAANLIAGSMLGIEPGEVNGEMPDAIGEVTNMIAGAFRTRMAEHGDAWAISVPTVTVGSDFYTKYVFDADRVLMPFKLDDSPVYVELILVKK
ncbi:MAG: chemotaxis protein CheX [Vicinamibacterales bacterium]